MINTNQQRSIPNNIYTFMISVLIFSLMKNLRAIDTTSNTNEFLSASTTQQPEAILKEEMNSNLCGIVVADSETKGFSFEVLEGSGRKISQAEFKAIYQYIRSLIIVIKRNNCFIEICSTSQQMFSFSADSTIFPDCLKYSANRTSLKIKRDQGYKIGSISCGCKKERPTCETEECSTSQNSNALSSPEVCGILYEESRCQECFHDGIVLNHADEFQTKNAAVIRSFLLRPGCEMDVITFGEIWRRYFNPSTKSYNRSTERLFMPTYTIQGEGFRCRCNKSMATTVLSNVLNDVTTMSITSTANAAFDSTVSPAVNISSTTALSNSIENNNSTFRTLISTNIVSNQSDPSSTSVEMLTTKHVFNVTINDQVELKLEPEYPTFGKIETILVAVGMALLLLAIILIALIYFFSRRKQIILKRPKQSQLVHDENVDTTQDSVLLFPTPYVMLGEEIKEFKEGVNFAQAANLSQAENVPISAFTLPYDSKFEIPIHNIQFDPNNPASEIGSGEFGIVYKGFLRTFYMHSSQEIAIKTLKIGKHDTANLKLLLNEIKVLSYLEYHSNIVHFLGACTVDLDKGKVLLILKYCSNGDLKSYLKEQQLFYYTLPLTSKQNTDKRKSGLQNSKVSGHPLSEYDGDSSDDSDEEVHEKIRGDIRNTPLFQALFNQLVKWSEEIASGMEHLHSKNVLHIDLSARNILLGDDFTAKITDFGLSRQIHDKDHYKKYGKDSIPMKWVALECLMNKTYSKKSDLWSYGVTLWEIFSLGMDPYHRLSFFEVFKLVQDGHTLPCPEFATNEIYNQLLMCWERNPEARPNFFDMKLFFQTHQRKK